MPQQVVRAALSKYEPFLEFRLVVISVYSYILEQGHVPKSYSAFSSLVWVVPVQRMFESRHSVVRDPAETGLKWLRMVALR